VPYFSVGLMGDKIAITDVTMWKSEMVGGNALPDVLSSMGRTKV